MSADEDLLASARRINPGAQLVKEGGHRFVYLPAQPVDTGERRRVLDALLCPGPHSGYATRLFLAEPVPERDRIQGQAANWTVHSILGRAWHSWSWQNVQASLPLHQMLLAHLHALR